MSEWYGHVFLHFQAWPFDVDQCLPTVLYISTIPLSALNSIFWFQTLYNVMFNRNLLFCDSTRPVSLKFKIYLAKTVSLNLGGQFMNVFVEGLDFMIKMWILNHFCIVETLFYFVPDLWIYSPFHNLLHIVKRSK